MVASLVFATSDVDASTADVVSGSAVPGFELSPGIPTALDDASRLVAASVGAGELSPVSCPTLLLLAAGSCVVPLVGAAVMPEPATLVVVVAAGAPVFTLLVVSVELSVLGVARTEPPSLAQAAEHANPNTHV